MLAAVAPFRPRRAPRIALYSHDALGLGHIRRNLAVAAALATAEPAPDLLVLSGAPESAGLARPRRCDVVTLPTVAKDANGGYAPRHLSSALTDVVAIRSSVLCSALAAFAPDLLIVDKLPRGFGGELEAALVGLTASRRTRVVLGLRDVLDEPEVARRDWAAQANTRAVERWYDQVWVYGDAAVLDPVVDNGLPAAVAERAVYTGYLVPRPRRHHLSGSSDGLALERPYVLGMVGGGQDGLCLAEAFASTPLPPGYRGVLVTGPHMPDHHAQRIADLAKGSDDLEVVPFVPTIEPVIAGASAVVGMGGYNTICELLAAGVPALIVPRVHPRLEQLIRAERLAVLGVLDVLRPDQLSAEKLGAWLEQAVHNRTSRPGSAMDLGGLTRLPGLAAALLARSPRISPPIPSASRELRVVAS
jgi:predicted glycosyltransferase